MPTIAWFYGIAIQMFYNDHSPPHLHARYGRARALVRISDGTPISGELPPTAARLVREWTLTRRPELPARTSASAFATDCRTRRR
jgi:hypothetical protein